MKSIVVGLALLVACGDNQPGARITLPGTPSFVMYEEAGVWKHPLVIQSNDRPPAYELNATGPYRFVWVCAGAYDSQTNGYYVDELFADYADGDQDVRIPSRAYLPSPCYNPPGISTYSAALGRVSQPGEVEVGNLINWSTEPNWLFTLQGSVGLHDVVAAQLSSNGLPDELGTATRIVVRRDVPFDGAAPQLQPTIDLESESLHREPVSVGVPANAPSQTEWSATTYLVDHGDWAPLTNANGGAYTFPLDADLHQYIELSFPGAGPYPGFGTFQRATFDVAGPRPAMLAPVPELEYPSRAQIAWNHEAADYQRFELQIGQTPIAFHGVMTAAYRGQFGPSLDLSIDSDVPGFRDEWRVIPDLSLRMFFITSGSGDDGVIYTTELDSHD